jgi:iron complex transport system substrate-binding protein
MPLVCARLGETGKAEREGDPEARRRWGCMQQGAALPARVTLLQGVSMINRLRLTVIGVVISLVAVAALFALGAPESSGTEAAGTASAPAAEKPGFPVTVVDDLGNCLTLADKPQRIVSLTIFTDEILLSLVDKDRLIAVTTIAADPGISNVVDQVADIPYKLTMNVETVISLRPDLVLVANWSDADPVKQLRNAGVPVYLMATGLSAAAIEQNIDRLSAMTGEQEKGRAMIARMRERLAAVAGKVSTLPEEKRGRVLDYSMWGSAQGRGSSWDEIVRLAGLVNAAGDFSADEWGQVPLSKERILDIDPDILVLPGWVYGDPKGAEAFFAQVIADPALKGLSAVKAKRVYMMPENLKSATSQYIATAVEWLAKTAYPELFP